MVLTPLAAPVLFVTGSTLFRYGVIQLEVSSLKCIHWGGRLSLRVLIAGVLSVRFCIAGSPIAIA